MKQLSLFITLLFTITSYASDHSFSEDTIYKGLTLISYKSNNFLSNMLIKWRNHIKAHYLFKKKKFFCNQNHLLKAHDISLTHGKYFEDHCLNTLITTEKIGNTIDDSTEETKALKHNILNGVDRYFLELLDEDNLFKGQVYECKYSNKLNQNQIKNCTLLKQRFSILSQKQSDAQFPLPCAKRITDDIEKNLAKQSGD
jgi:hypothetical protein